MNNYNPDGYAIIKALQHDNTYSYFVFGSWSGGYLDKDYWRRNSGIERFEENDDYYYFYGYSGSCYRCSKSSNHITMYNQGILNHMTVNNKVMEVEVISVEQFKQEWEKK